VATLYANTGPLAGKTIRLAAEVVFGRDGADVTIEDPELSRRHVAVRVLEQGVEVEDLGSTNGTFVDDRRIEAPTRVGGGALIRLGATTFELRGVLRVKGQKKSHEIPKGEVTRRHSVPNAAVTRPHKIPEPEVTRARSVTNSGVTQPHSIPESEVNTGSKISE
jgi:pSer/pThr/pTyr-binding forkhead associated (FHA) protein